MSQEGHSFALFPESRDSGAQCEIVNLQEMDCLQQRVHALELEKKSRIVMPEQTVNSVNERKKLKYINHLNTTIKEISEYIMKLTKVLQSNEPFDTFIQLEKIQRMYNNSYDLMTLMDSHYKIILQGLVDKTLSKLSRKNIQVFNHLDIIHLDIVKHRERDNHVEY